MLESASDRKCPEYGCAEASPNDLDADVIDADVIEADVNDVATDENGDKTSDVSGGQDQSNNLSFDVS